MRGRVLSLERFLMEREGYADARSDANSDVHDVLHPEGDLVAEPCASLGRQVPDALAAGRRDREERQVWSRPEGKTDWCVLGEGAEKRRLDRGPEEGASENQEPCTHLGKDSQAQQRLEDSGRWQQMLIITLSPVVFAEAILAVFLSPVAG